jgi:hypothetical protein
MVVLDRDILFNEYRIWVSENDYNDNDNGKSFGRHICENYELPPNRYNKFVSDVLSSKRADIGCQILLKIIN